MFRMYWAIVLIWNTFLCLLKLTGGYCRCNICHDFEICKDSSRFLPFLEHLIWLDQFSSIFFSVGLLGRLKKKPSFGIHGHYSGTVTKFGRFFRDFWDILECISLEIIRNEVGPWYHLMIFSSISVIINLIWGIYQVATGERLFSRSKFHTWILSSEITTDLAEWRKSYLVRFVDPHFNSCALFWHLKWHWLTATKRWSLFTC